MARTFDDIMKTIGNTPLVRINRLTAGAGATVEVPEHMAISVDSFRAKPLSVLSR